MDEAYVIDKNSEVDAAQLLVCCILRSYAVECSVSVFLNTGSHDIYVAFLQLSRLASMELLELLMTLGLLNDSILYILRP